MNDAKTLGVTNKEPAEASQTSRGPLAEEELVEDGKTLTLAEDEPVEAAETSWWGIADSVWATVKDATEKVVEVYKEDLADFATNVSADTELIVEEVKRSEMLEAARVRATEGTNFLVNHLVEGIAGDEDAATPVRTPPANRLEAKILELQRDMGTFCTVPTGDDFVSFSDSFVAANEEKRIISLLSSSTDLTSHYNKIVPTMVGYDDFWKRYLFREMHLRERENEREEFIRKASEMTAVTDLGWDDDSNDDSNNSGSEWTNDNSFSSITATPAGGDKDDLLLDGWDDPDDLIDQVKAEPILAIQEQEKEETGRNSEEGDVKTSGLDSVAVIEDWGGWE